MNTSFDYNLIKFLVTVMETKNMAAAATRLDIAPSGVSNAIAKLREYFNDPLFIKINGGVQATPLAITLYEQYVPVIATLDDAAKINRTSSQQIRRRFQIRTNSLVEYWLSFHVLKKGILLPGDSLNFVSSVTDNDIRLSMLRRREVDLDIGLVLERDASIYSEHLFDTEITLVCRQDHPRISDTITTEAYAKEQYVIWSSALFYTELTESLEEFLTQRGHNVLISTESFINIMLNVIHSDLVACMPRFFLPLLTSSFPIKEVKVDFLNNRKSSVYAYFHKSESKNRMIRQLIDTIKIK
ncbi:TPA: LysR family transcriptional regulator [Serratia fonticola]